MIFTTVQGEQVQGTIIAEHENVYIVQGERENYVVPKNNMMADDDATRRKPVREVAGLPKHRLGMVDWAFYYYVRLPNGETFEGYSGEVTKAIGIGGSQLHQLADKYNGVKVPKGKYKGWIFEKVVPVW